MAMNETIHFNAVVKTNDDANPEYKQKLDVETSPCDSKNAFFDSVKYQSTRLKNAMNRKVIDWWINNCKIYFKLYPLIYIVSAFNVVSVLILMLIYFFFSFITFLPVFFLFFSLLSFLQPLIYPLIKEHLKAYYDDSVILCFSIGLGLVLFIMSVIFIWLAPLLVVFLYPYIGLFVPAIATCILPLMGITNIVVCLIHLTFYTDAFPTLIRKLEHVFNL